MGSTWYAPLPQHTATISAAEMAALPVSVATLDMGDELKSGCEGLFTRRVWNMV